MIEADDDRAINAILTEVAMGPRQRPVRHAPMLINRIPILRWPIEKEKEAGFVVRILRKIRRTVYRNAVFAFWWVALRTWKRPLIRRGKLRWRQMAGIDTAERVKPIDLPPSTTMTKALNVLQMHRAELIGIVSHPHSGEQLNATKPDFE